MNVPAIERRGGGHAAEADVLIVGGGPAGSVLAGLLAQQDIDTVVLDRATFPRPKPCGEYLNPGVVAVLDRLGLLGAVLRTEPARISGWKMMTGSGVTATGRYAPTAPHGLGIQRSAVDEALVCEAKRRGARVVERVKVHGLRVAPSGERHAVTVEAVNGQGRPVAWKARIVVGADGLRSVVARRLGLVRRRPGVRKVSLTCRLKGTGPPRGDGRLFLTGWGTVGLAPVHASEPLWNGTVVVYVDRGARDLVTDPLGWFLAALRQAPFRWDGDGPEVVGGPWTSGPFDWALRDAVSDRVLLVGDAAGSFDPLTGQGMFQAFRSAELAAPIIVRAVRHGRSAAADLVDYRRALSRLLRPTRVLQRVIEAAVSRNWAREIAVTRLRAAEPFMDRLVQVVGDTLPVHSLVRPDALLSVLNRAAVRG